MSAEPSAQHADWDSVRESLARICASHDEFAHFFSGVFGQLDGLADELMRRQRGWMSQRERSEEELARRAGELEQERAALAAQREQLAKEACRRGDAAGAGPGENQQQFRQMLEEVEQQRAALRDAQQAAQTQTTRLAELTDELSEARHELSESWREVCQRREELEAAPADGGGREPDRQLEEQLRRVERERAELERERSVLETELDSVRNRAAEMAETVSVQRRQLAEERAQWKAELKRMRRVLERLTQQRGEEESAGGWQEPSTTTRSMADEPLETVSAAASPGDPVLGSVMAQFEMLQKDLARRRKKTPSFQ